MAPTLACEKWPGDGPSIRSVSFNGLPRGSAPDLDPVDPAHNTFPGMKSMIKTKVRGGWRGRGKAGAAGAKGALFSLLPPLSLPLVMKAVKRGGVV